MYLRDKELSMDDNMRTDNQGFSSDEHLGSGEQMNVNYETNSSNQFNMSNEYTNMVNDTNSTNYVKPPKKKRYGWKIALLVILIVGLMGGGAYGVSRVMGSVIKNLDGYVTAIYEVESERAKLDIAEEADIMDELEIQDEVDADVIIGEQAEEETLNIDTEIEVTDPVGSGAIVTDVTDVVEKVMPSVVSINNILVEQYLNPFNGDVYSEEGVGSGSGIIFGQNEDEILIVTNHHVIEDYDQLIVQFIDGEEVEAHVKGADSAVDLAVIAIQIADINESTLSEIAMARFGDSTSLTVGEPAIAIGNALGYGQSVTTGVISALERTVGDDTIGYYENLIQTDAAINPGNSGGALLNIKGEVIGINSNKIGGESIEGMGYAIPISKAIPIIDELMQSETRIKIAEAERGYIGIQGADMTADLSEYYGIPVGVYIAEVHSGSGAEVAGLKMGDVITAVNGKETLTMSDLQKELQYYADGDVITLTIWQENENDYQEVTMDVELADASILVNQE